MKKIVILVCSVMLPLAAYAQKGKAIANTLKKPNGSAVSTLTAPGGGIAGKVGAATQRAANAAAATHMATQPRVTSSTPSVAAPKAPTVPATTTYTPTVSSLASKGEALPQPAPHLPSSQELQQRQATAMPSNTKAPTMDELQKIYQEELAKNTALNAERAGLAFQADFGKSVLFAPLMSGENLGYSVTVVEIEGEIFGVIPSHSLPYDYYANLSKEFYVKLTAENGSTQRVRATVVQVSSDSMLDISLVKFSPESESLLHPLKLASTSAQIGDILFSYGYAVGKETVISRTVNAQSFISMRTNQAIEGSREGFCGSPLLNAKGEVTGIHTGTVEKEGNEPDVSFGTHARFIQLLADAYHNNGQAMYDLELDGNTIARLNVDEYISNYRLFDANGKMIAQQNIPGKYSESLLRETLRSHPQAKYMHLTTRKAYWETHNLYDANKISPQMLEMTGNSTEFSLLRENRGKTDKTKRQHWYNLQTQQIEPARPAIIKM